MKDRRDYSMMPLQSITLTSLCNGSYLVDWVRIKPDGSTHISSMFARKHWAMKIFWINVAWNYNYELDTHGDALTLTRKEN
jgi:hypothetical protein